MEVNTLIGVNTCFLSQALDQAKEAVSKEKNLTRQRDQAATETPPNLDLTYCVRSHHPCVTKTKVNGELSRLCSSEQVMFNLAVQYANNEMFMEALNTYQLIVKNKAFSNVGRG